MPLYSWWEQNNSLILLLGLDGVQHLQGRVQKKLLEVSYCGDGQCVSSSTFTKVASDEGGWGVVVGEGFV